MDSKGWMVATALLAAHAAQATCYSVHKADGSLVLETSRTPVDLTLPLSDTVPEKFGAGAFMTMSATGVFCRERRVGQEAKEVAAVAVPVKRRVEAKVEAPLQELSDDEVLALKPEDPVPTAPVQAVEVKVVGVAEEAPAGEAVKAQRQMGAAAAAGTVAARVK